MRTFNAKSQKAFIRQTLESDGRVTRNAFLQFGITRLAARILDLRDEGYQIIGRMTEHNDYEYILIRKPLK